MSHKANYWLAELDPDRVKAGAFRVLFHLCAHHNSDEPADRACFPSQETLMKRTALSNGGLNNALNALEEAGLIRRVRGTIPGQPTPRTYYVLGCDYEAWAGQTPVSGGRAGSTFQGGLAPVSEGAGSTFQGGCLQPTGEEQVITGKGTGKDKIKGADEALTILSQEASANAAASFLAYRRKTKGGALSATGATRLAATLRQISQLGHDPDDALGMAEERGWQTVKLDWYLREISSEQHRSSPALRNRPAAGSAHRPDPALEQIARLAGLG